MTSPTTDTIDLGALRVPGGFVVRRTGAPERTPFAPSTGESEPYRYSFTYLGGGSTTRNDLLDLIDSARRKVFVASYFIGDAQVRDALRRAADRLRGGVYVISAMNERDFKRAINEVSEHEEIDEQLERKRFEQLTQYGIAVRAYEGCHAKFAVVDDRAALVSSANLTTAGLDTTGENGVLVTEPAEVDQLARFFATLWHGSQWEMAPGGGRMVTKRTAGPRSIRLPPPELDANGPIWTLHTEHHIKETIARLIESTRTELLLATYSLDGMTSRPGLLVDHVRAALDRGVRVRLLLRGRNHVPSHVADSATLARMGIELYPCRYNHAKGVIADRERGALFSANFDARHGLDRDIELGMRLDGTPALVEALRYFEHAIAERDLDYVLDPTAAVLADRIYSFATTRWPLPATIDVFANENNWASLAEVTDGPVLFAAHGDDMRLYAGRRVWLLTRPAEPGSQLVGLDQRERTSASARLTEWLTGPREHDDPTARGICAATLRRTEPPPSGVQVQG